MRFSLSSRWSSACAIALASWVLVTVSGCRASQSRTVLETSTAEDVPILWEKSGTYSRLTRRVRVVARDPATLAQLPLTEIPVDFDSQMVLIAGLGPTPGSDRGIRIVRVWKQGARIRVQERPIHPGLDPTPGLTPGSPWTVVVIPKSDLNVEGYASRVPKGALGDHPGSR